MPIRNALQKPAKEVGKIKKVVGSEKVVAGRMKISDRLLSLQHTVGNNTVGQMIQAKLKVGQRGDQYEQEADRLANKVVRVSESNTDSHSPPLGAAQTVVPQRKSGCGSFHSAEGDCEEYRGRRLPRPQGTPDNSPKTIPQLQTQINKLRSGGQPLQRETRAYFAPRFGVDFSSVRVHTDLRAAETARSVNAKAFTLGEHVFFGAGEYVPKNSAGQRLLAHELTHVIQQGVAQPLYPTGLPTAVQSTGHTLIQRSPLSDELTEIWLSNDKASFFQRLRTISDSDPDVAEFVAVGLRGDDRWLAEIILRYGPERNWPIHLRVESAMKPWAGGRQEVFDLLREANGVESGNAELTAVLNRVFAGDPQSLSTASRLQHFQRQETASDIAANVMDLTGRGRTLDERSVTRVQERLIELGLLSEETEGFESGQMNDATRNAIIAFQEAHAADIEQVVEDSNALESRGAGPADARAGTGFRRGEIRPDDATAQALANAWPRRFFGVLLQNEAEAFEYIASQVVTRGLPFDRNRVNIVGIRGFQGGESHDNPGMRLRRNRYDDSFFILALDQNNQPRLREFRGTTDPGGRSSAGGNRDRRTHAMGADQQLPYLFRYRPGGTKANRPMLSQLVGTPENPRVIDPRREEMIHEYGSIEPDTRSPVRTSQEVELAEGAENFPRHEQLRTTFGSEGEQLRGMTQGIAIHSGGGGETVTAWSTGCQVVQGSWYGSFMQTIRRALTWQNLRAQVCEDIPETPALGDLVTEGVILYTLLDGRDLLPPSRTQRVEMNINN